MTKMIGLVLMTTALGCGYTSEEFAYANGDTPTMGKVVESISEGDFISTDDEATSTFSIDVDTASYTLMRQAVRADRLPTPDQIRLEEYVNFFDYDYPEPADGMPFSINLEAAPSAFGEELHMMRVGLKGRHVSMAELRPVNLVFLVDTSGSMGPQIELLRHSLNVLVENLRPTDTVGIVTYAGRAGTLLEPTQIGNGTEIYDAIGKLTASGSTNGESGLRKAYELAKRVKQDDAINRVVLVTDGDFNVGLRGQELSDYVQSMRDEHIGLTVGGFGVSGYADNLLKSFAQYTNGNYVYIDSVAEADRVFSTELPSVLEVIAADVKVQVEFNPESVVRYRLVGYELRLLENEHFEDDTKDAGEIGPDHTVTALYEVQLADDLTAQSGVVAEVRLRHKPGFGADSVEQVQQIKSSQVKASLEDATGDLKFAMAVVEFAELLRESKHTTGDTIDQVEALAAANATDDKRTEFVGLVQAAKPLL